MKALRLIVTQASSLRVQEPPVSSASNTERGSARHLRAGSVHPRPFYLNSPTLSTSFVRFDTGQWLVTVWSA